MLRFEPILKDFFQLLFIRKKYNLHKKVTLWMLYSKMKLRNNHIILMGILLVAGILRFYHFFELQFFHDEYSAIVRTSYSNTHDLITQGVLPDFHPAGVQVFLFYWVHLFGTATWVVKLPFVLMNIASIYLLYVIAKRWSNETVGLISAAFLATTQYTILYGIYARPYSSGLFFTLLLVLALTNFIQRPDHRFWWNWLLFVLAGTACAYNQYVNMLIAGIIGISVLPLVPRKIILKYIIAGVAIGILYIPHLPILFFHLSKGGVGGGDGWLPPPDPEFITNYLAYLGHYSWWSLVLVLFILIFGWYQNRFVKTEVLNTTSNYRLYFFLCWFVTPFLICYFYSVYKNPILQFSVLIFTHFTIYLFLFGWLKPLKPVYNFTIVAAIILTNTLTLIYVREHYHVNYNVGYASILDQLEIERKKHPGIPALVQTDPRFSEFEQQQRKHPIQFDPYTFTSNTELIHYLDSVAQKSDYFYFVFSAETSPETVPVIQHYFPVIEQEHVNQVNTIYVFSKQGKKHSLPVIDHWIPSAGIPKKWNNTTKTNCIQIEDKWYYKIDSLSEWGPEIVFDLKDISAAPHNMIDIEISTKGLAPEKEVIITASITDKDSTLMWTGGSTYIQIDNSDQGKIFHSITISDMDYIQNNQLKIMIWNKSKTRFYIEDVIIRLREGNPYKYGVLYPIYPTVTSTLTGLQPQ